jgi:hypothetical protein
MKSQGVDHVINGAENVLSFTVMRRSVWVGHMQDHPIGHEERYRGSIVELTTIVAQDNFIGMTKLCEDISEKFDKVGKVSNLTHKGKVHRTWERSSRITR